VGGWTVEHADAAASSEMKDHVPSLEGLMRASCKVGRPAFFEVLTWPQVRGSPFRAA
jgi:hypothetical protein